MSTDRTEIQVDLSEALGRMNRIDGNIEDMDALFADIEETMLSDISQHFEDEAGPGGKPWKALAPSTIKAREKKGHWPGKKLQVQGRGSGLLGALQSEHDDESASVTNNKIYAAIQNLGGKAGPGKKVTIPARPYMYLSADAEEEIKDAVEFHITK